MTKLSETVAKIERLEGDLKSAKSALERMESFTSSERVELRFAECHLDLGYRQNMTIGEITKAHILQAIKEDFAAHLTRAIEAMEASVAEQKEQMLIQAAQFVAGKDDA